VYVCLCVCLSVYVCLSVCLCLLGMINMLLVTRRTDLRLISLDVPYFADVVLPIQTDMQAAVAADIDPLTGQ